MVQLEGVHKRYGEGAVGVEALSGVSLCVGTREYLAVTGPSGSGKSTLLAVLGLVERPDGGRYLFDGTDVRELGDRELSKLRARTVGFVFQAFHLLPELTALENVMLPLRYGELPKAAWRNRAAELLALVGLAERMNHRPTQLSGGEQQRVAIARALANDPRLILADEPTGNLDSRTRDEVLGLLESLYDEGRALIVVTHDPEVAARASRRVQLRDGRFVGKA
jgi:putative ABC transport system ATP-binding protein